MLNLAQQEVGALQWLALKTRPDIAAITAICASMQTKDHERAYKFTQEIWKYLWTTKNLGMKIVPEKMVQIQLQFLLMQALRQEETDPGPEWQSG